MNRRFNQNLNQSNLLKEPPGVYRHSKLGKTLNDAVGELVQQKKLTPFLEYHIMNVFDRRVAEISMYAKKEGLSLFPMSFHGKKDDHYFIDGTWEIHLTDVAFYDESQDLVKVDKLVIMAENWTDKSVQQHKTAKGLMKRKR